MFLSVCALLSVFLSSMRVWGGSGHDLPFFQPSDPEDETPLAILEWSDVAVILVWFGVFITFELPDYRLGFVKVPKKTQDREVQISEKPTKVGATTEILAFLSASNLVLVITFFMVATVGSTWALGVREGVVPNGTLPLVSDLWWKPPGNWISRWGLNIIASLLYLHEINAYYMNTDPKSESGSDKLYALGLALVGIVGSFGLAAVGCIDEKENVDLHDDFTALFFYGYDVYMLLYTSIHVMRYSSHSATTTAFTCFVISTMTKLRYWQEDKFTIESPHSSDQAIYEWVDLLVVLFFINITSRYNPARRSDDEYGVALFKLV